MKKAFFKIVRAFTKAIIEATLTIWLWAYEHQQEKNNDRHH